MKTLVILMFCFRHYIYRRSWKDRGSEMITYVRSNVILVIADVHSASRP